MSERILKLQSQQNYNEVAVPGAFTQKLIDFSIPASGMTYDLARSYISINMAVINLTGLDAAGVAPAGVDANDKALYVNEISLSSSADFASQHLASNSAICRNADMVSSSKGMVESIRQVAKLRAILWNLENNGGEKLNGLDKLGIFQGRRGIKNETSTLLQTVGQNVSMNGTIDPSIQSVAITRDFRIPLSDLFGVGSSKWNTDYFGETRIHLEIQPNLLQIEQLGGDEGATTSQQNGQNATFGQMIDYSAAGVGTLAAGKDFGQGDHPLVTTLLYDDPDLDFPFHVGQAVIVTYTADPVNAAPTAPQIILSLEHCTAATKTRLALTNVAATIGSMIVTFKNPLITAIAATTTITLIKMSAALSQSATNQIQINGAELVLSEIDDDGPRGMDYTTYSTEEVQGQDGLTTMNKQIIVEPNCSNLVINSSKTGRNFGTNPWHQYRIAINNVDQSGNRDIIYGQSIHKNRLERFFKNRNQEFTNSTLNQVACNQEQRTPYVEGTPPGQGNQAPYYPICETMPLTEMPKIVNLELEALTAGDIQDVSFFKELQKTI